MTPAQAAWLRKLRDEGPQGTFHMHGLDMTEIDACQNKGWTRTVNHVGRVITPAGIAALEEWDQAQGSRAT